MLDLLLNVYNLIESSDQVFSVLVVHKKTFQDNDNGSSSFVPSIIRQDNGGGYEES